MSTAFAHLPIVTNGLNFSFDAYNRKSYVSGTTSTYNLRKTSDVGTLYNGVEFDGSTFSFDGTNDSINFGSIITLGSTYTLEAWVKPTSDHNGIVMSMDDGVGGTRLFQLKKKNTGTFQFIYFYGGGSFVQVDTSVTSNTEWHHIVAVYNGTNGRCYLNGVLDGVGSNQVVDTGTTDLIFGSIGDGGNPYLGLISRGKIYDKALSETEILQNYNATKGRYK